MNAENFSLRSNDDEITSLFFPFFRPTRKIPTMQQKINISSNTINPNSVINYRSVLKDSANETKSIKVVTRTEAPTSVSPIRLKRMFVFATNFALFCGGCICISVQASFNTMPFDLDFKQILLHYLLLYCIARRSKQLVQLNFFKGRTLSIGERSMLGSSIIGEELLTNGSKTVIVLALKWHRKEPTSIFRYLE